MQKIETNRLLAEIARLKKREQRLERTAQSLLQRLEDERRKRELLADAIFRAAKEGIDALDIKMPDPPKLGDDYQHKEQVAIAVLSDWQIGKVTPTYSTKVCAERIELYADKMESIVSTHRQASPVRELRVYLVGDLVEGELIFPGQAHHIDASLYKQVTLDGPSILGRFLMRALAFFERVRVVCVHGNHGSLGGRSRKEYHPESNADLMLYRIVQYMFHNEPRIEFSLPDRVRSWYNYDRIGKWGFLLFHGDQMRGGGFAGLPFYAFSRAVHSWSSGAIPEKFDYAICGHWHQGASLPFNRRILWVNGSVESYNIYAQEQLKSMSAPHQWLLMCHPEHGVTAEYRVWLGEYYGWEKKRKKQS